MSVIGLEVPHVHVHLIPLNHMEDIRFVQKIEMSAQEFEGLAQAIASHFEG